MDDLLPTSTAPLGTILSMRANLFVYQGSLHPLVSHFLNSHFLKYLPFPLALILLKSLLKAKIHQHHSHLLLSLYKMALGQLLPHMPMSILGGLSAVHWLQYFLFSLSFSSPFDIENRYGKHGLKNFILSCQNLSPLKQTKLEQRLLPQVSDHCSRPPIIPYRPWSMTMRGLKDSGRRTQILMKLTEIHLTMVAIKPGVR